MAITWFIGRGFPPVNTDEAILSNHAYNLISGNTNRYSLYDDIFDRELYAWRDATAGLLQIVYEAWLGPFVAWLPKTVENARLSSITAGFFTLLFWFLIGRRLNSSGLGVACMIMGWTHPLFQLSSQLVRAEMVLVLAATVTIYLTLVIEDDFRWKYPLLGALAGAQIGIHQNSVPIFLGLLAFIWLRSPSNARGARAAMLIGSSLVGGVAVLASIDLTKFWFSQQFIVYDLYRPPVLSWPWNPLDWVSHWAPILVNGSPSWYLPNNSHLLWRICFWLYGAAILFLLFTGFKRGRSSWPFLAGVLAVFLGLCGFIRKEEAIYGVVLLPFLIPAMGGLAKGRKSFLLIFFLAIFSLYAGFTFKYRAQIPSYQNAVDKIRGVSQPQARIAGPNVLWFSWPDENFRDISALVGSRWITGGKREIKKWLSPWQPDIVVIEPSWKKMLLGPGETGALLQNALQRPVTALGQVEFDHSGPWEIFQIHWVDRS